MNGVLCLMIRRARGSTQGRASAASNVYKRQTSESSEGRRGSPGFVSSPGNQPNSDSDENLFELSSCGITLFLNSPATLLDSSCDPVLRWKDVDGEVKHGVDLKQALVALCDLLDAPDPPNVPTGVEKDTTQDFDTADSLSVESFR